MQDKIWVRPYVIRDQDTLLAWLNQRKMPEEYIVDLPELGVVSLYQNKKIAMGFLRKVEGNLALIDSLIADPFCPWELRSLGIDQVVSDLISQAKKSHIKRIIAYSINGRTLERSKKYGFESIPYQMISLDLKEEL